MGLALAALVLSNPWVCTVHAGGKDRGRSIEFSEPKSDEISTNLHQLTSKKDSLKQLEEDLYKSVRTFSGGSSLDGVPAPPVRPPSGPVIPSKRVREWAERHKNAIFLTPEDLVPTPTAEEILKMPEYGPDGLEMTKKKPMELYYERLDAKRAAALKASRAQDDESFNMPNSSSRREVSPQSDDFGLLLGLKEREQDLKKLFETEAAAAGPAFSPTPSRRSSFSDVFGLGENVLSPEKAVEHKKLMDDFRSIYEFSRPASSSADVPNALPSSSEPSRREANPFAAPGTSAGGNSQLGAINPIFTPSGPQDVNDQLLGQSSVTPLLPKTAPAKPPPSPIVIAPRRPF